MKRPHHGSSISLQARFVLGLGTVLLPLVALALAAVLSMQGTITRFQRAIVTAQQDTSALAHLESTLRASAINDAVENRVANPRPAYDALVSSIESGFTDLEHRRRPAPEAHLVVTAGQEWQQARTVIDGLLGLSAPERAQLATEKMKVFRQHFYLSRDSLKEAIHLSELAVQSEFRQARQSQHQTFIVILSVCVLGALVVVAVGRLLARSVLVPLGALLDAATARKMPTSCFATPI
jgi:hypothetical protein